MGLRDEIAADIAEAFDDDLADAVNEFTGSRQGLGAWDPVTETWTSVPVTYSGRGVFGEFEIDVVDGINILRTDVKLTALQSEVTGTPKVDDKVEQQGGPAYKVIHVGQDPASVSWSVQLRAV